MHVLRVCSIVCLGLFVTSCKKKPENPWPHATQTIASGGGTIKLSNGALFEFPKDAVSKKTTITVNTNLNARTPPHDSLVPASLAYELTPHGTQFAKPVKVTIPANTGNIKKGGTTLIWRLDNDKDTTWKPVLATVVNDGIVTFNTNHFSIFLGFITAQFCTASCDASPAYYQALWNFEYSSLVTEVTEVNQEAAMVGSPRIDCNLLDCLGSADSFANCIGSLQTSQGVRNLGPANLGWGTVLCDSCEVAYITGICAPTQGCKMVNNKPQCTDPTGFTPKLCAPACDSTVLLPGTSAHRASHLLELCERYEAAQTLFLSFYTKYNDPFTESANCMARVPCNGEIIRPGTLGAATVSSISAGFSGQSVTVSAQAPTCTGCPNATTCPAGDYCNLNPLSGAGACTSCGSSQTALSEVDDNLILYPFTSEAALYSFILSDTETDLPEWRIQTCGTTCAYKNGGCDPLTSCYEEYSSILCGACPSPDTWDGSQACSASGGKAPTSNPTGGSGGNSGGNSGGGSGGGGSGGGSGGGTSCITKGPTTTGTKNIFVTSDAYGPNSSGLSDADSYCQFAANERGLKTTFKALLVDGTNRIACTSANCQTCGSTEQKDWVLYADTTYVIYSQSLPQTTIATTNDYALFQFPLSNSGGFGAFVNYWSGLSADWTTSGSTCSGWTSNKGSDYGEYGLTSASDSTAIASSTSPCSNNYSNHLVCVEQ